MSSDEEELASLRRQRAEKLGIPQRPPKVPSILATTFSETHLTSHRHSFPFLRNVHNLKATPLLRSKQIARHIHISLNNGEQERRGWRQRRKY